MPMKTKDLSNEQLRIYFAEHVRYEMQMLIRYSWAIEQGIQTHPAIKHAPVEAYAIHLRNLITFLYPHAPHSDDVCAKDFFTNDALWEKIRPELGSLLKMAKKRADKEVGHLTTARQSGTPRGKEWNVANLTAELMPKVVFFCQSANRIALKKDIEPLLSELRIMRSATI